MKNKEETEQLAETAFQDELIKSNQDINWIGYGKGIDGTSKERWIELWIKGYTKCQEDMSKDQTVTRFEVIDTNGRVYQKWNCNVELSYQDDGRTLKVFIKQTRLI